MSRRARARRSRTTALSPVRNALRALGAFTIRPTSGAFVALLLAVFFLVLGSQLLAVAFVAVAVAIGLALAAGLISVIAAWHAAGPHAAPVSRTRALAGRVERIVAARAVYTQTTWTQIDQRGRIVGSDVGEDIPEQRGLYRAGGTVVRFRDPFGCWTARRTVPSGQELWIAPPVHDRPHPALHAESNRLRAHLLLADRERAGALVRPYEKGDPLRAIAWRASAHHGRLMSFDPEQTRRVVPIVVADTLGAAETDALAAEALTACDALSRLRGARNEVMLTDGVARAQGMRACERFAAAIQADAAHDAAHAGHDAATRAEAIRHLASSGDASRAHAPIVLITEHPDGALARALEALSPALDITVAAPRPLESALDPQDQRERATDRLSARRMRARRQWHMPLPPFTCDIASLLCCLIFIALSMHLLGGLIEPGTWREFGGVALSLTAASAILLPWVRLGWHRWVRPLVSFALFVLMAVVAIFVAANIIHTGTGIDILDPHAGLTPLGIDRDGGGVTWAPFVLFQGIFDMYYGNWVPVEVTPLSDAALVLAMVPIALVLNALFVSNRLRPLLFLLPVGLLATQTLCLGTADDLPLIGLSLFLGLALRVLSQSGAAIDSAEHVERPRIPKPVRSLRAGALACCVGIALLTSALAVRATQASQALPIDLGVQSNVLVGSTVNPLMDLKSDLERPSETVALTYRTSLNRPVYLRLTSLSNLSGDTWMLDDSIPSTDGGFLGSLFSAASGSDQPAALPGESASDEFTVEVIRDTGASAVGSVRAVDATVVIEGLASRFVPLPIGAYDTEVAEDVQPGDWRWSDTDAVYGTQSTTNRGLVYTAEAAYIDPITDSTGLQGVSNQLVSTLWSRQWTGQSVSTVEEWQDLRERIDQLYEDERAAIDPVYLELPEELPQQIQEVVSEARTHMGEEAGISQLLSDEIDALWFLLDYFDGLRFTYSLDAPDGDGRNNLEVIAQFLDSGSGYCVHYASAFAVLGRALGVPTRIALGYRGDPGQADGDRYVATNHDLHAWTEAYLYGIGWVPFDVTPPSTSTGGTVSDEREEPEDTDAQQPDEQEQPEQEAPDQQPDVEDPDAAGSGDEPEADDLFAGMWAALGEIAAKARAYAPIAGAIAVVIALICAPRLLRRARRALRMRAVRDAAEHPGRAAEAAWAEALDCAHRGNIALEPSATEEDIARTIADAAPATRAEIQLLADIVCRTRYGDATQHIDAPTLIRALNSLHAAFEQRVKAKSDTTPSSES